MYNIPVITIKAKTIPEAWEKAVIATWKDGVEIGTEYDKKGDPPSKDCTMIIEVEEPLSEPRIHRAFPGGLEDLEVYRQEVILGVHDHWIKPEEGKWLYTYHQRLFNYPGQGVIIDQIEYIIKKLSATPYSRRAQAITWNVDVDPPADDAPCFLAGTLIYTPNGNLPIENLRNGDSVYAVDLENGTLVTNEIKNYFSKVEPCVKLSLWDRELTVSSKQLILSRDGWKTAYEFRDGDLIRISTVASGNDVSDQMVVGFMHGDGWLSSIKNSHGNFCRGYICFSLHPDADPTWIYEYLGSHSQNKIVTEKRYISSDIASGYSQKIKINDKPLWNKLLSMGCPVGTKKEQDIKWSVDNSTIDECRDFLTGIYSAEGCIRTREGRGGISIELGMTWKQCVDLVGRILDKVGIEYSMYTSNNVYSIRIHKISEVRKAIDTFDFRLDSRKQAKWIAVKSSLEYSNSILLDRQDVVYSAVEYSKETQCIQKELRSRFQNFNSRWLSDDYEPTFRFHMVDVIIEDNGVWLPIISVTETGYNTVYDFEVSHKDHSIIANGIVAHNCLQRIWCRIVGEDDPALNMNTHWRSRDGYKAAFMNIFAIIDLQRLIAQKISENLGKEVKVGRYVDISDSFHIYGSYYDEFKGFLKTVETRTFEERTWNTEFAEPMFEEAREKLKKEKKDG